MNDPEQPPQIVAKPGQHSDVRWNSTRDFTNQKELEVGKISFRQIDSDKFAVLRSHVCLKDIVSSNWIVVFDWAESTVVLLPPVSWWHFRFFSN